MIRRRHPYFAYVGSRTTRERKARGAGITVYRVAPEGDAWATVQVVSGLVNPSFLALDRGNQCLYAVHGDETEISAFRIDRGTGRLEFINRVATGGKNPVHLAIDPTNRFIVVANHVTSTLAVLPIGAGGALGASCDLVTLSGKVGHGKTSCAVSQATHLRQSRRRIRGEAGAVREAGETPVRCRIICIMSNAMRCFVERPDIGIRRYV
jgi:6-phosphogluconolactonase (cycloisomerase 2 family)